MGRVSPAAISFLLACAYASAQAPRVELVPVVAGLDQPVFVTSADDGTHRLFIVEQPGVIRVLSGGSGTPARFLDISSRVLAGGERGLLGLAFHPQFASNGRFYVNYTRQPDGATVIAAYRVSVGNPNLADPAETVLLTVPQPYSNHNGGMLAFGPDGYLYIGLGDGGSGNDPGNRAQNPRELLGKILRIDVDGPERYSSPSSNPFAVNGEGRSEIYALGLRNPWRFSFDRATGQLYVGDVGQGEVEEVDIVRLGGNYGWRVLEGTRCTGLGPAACDTPSFVPPIAEYRHEGGRCSVTGGYAYRGMRGSLPSGTYVYGDFCSGELFFLNGSRSGLLMDTDLNISSFGEDESGEIYVTSLSNGTLYRIANPAAPAPSTLYFPLMSTGNATSDMYTGFAVTGKSDGERLTFTAFDGSGDPVNGTGITNPQTHILGPGEQVALVDAQIWGPGFTGANRGGWAKVESDADGLAGFFLVFDSGLTLLDGADTRAETLGTFVLPEIEPQGFTRIHMINPASGVVSATMELIAADGGLRSRVTREIAGNGSLEATLQDLFPNIGIRSTDYVKVSATGNGVAAFEYLGVEGRHSRGLNGQDGTAGATTLYAPQYVSDASYTSTLSLINLEAVVTTVSLQLRSDDGTAVGTPFEITLGPTGKAQVGDVPGASGQGYLEIRSDRARLTGSVTFKDARQDAFAAALPLEYAPARNLLFSQVASDGTYFTGIALLNPGQQDATASINVSDAQGNVIESGEFQIRAHARISRTLTEYFPGLSSRNISSGYIRVTSREPLAGFALFGTHALSALSAIPAQK